MTALNLSGTFYPRFLIKQNYSHEVKTIIEYTVLKLLELPTSENKPVMLLGKIQSGKTKAFLGIMALSFDNGYDIAVVLTKGTIALTKQTLDRINREFAEFISDDMMQVFDVLVVPEKLTNFNLSQKLVFVAKKETHNISHLTHTILQKYEQLSGKRILIIDDEADHASVGFRRIKDKGITQNVIAEKIDDFRSNLMKPSFLQVTATPYSLYLQPSEFEDDIYNPIRPIYTELLPESPGYIGGDYYFYESQEENSIAYFLFEPLSRDELIVLEGDDRRRFRIEECLLSPSIKSLRSAIINFIVGGVIRRIQSKSPKKYSFIIHTATSKETHGWQEEVITTIIDKLIESVNSGKIDLLDKLIRPAYDDLALSINVNGLLLPLYDDTFLAVCDALTNGYVIIRKVNSDKDIKNLLDDQGQLRLMNPLNIFIGGQILDRGITVSNLIGFFYGRNPDKFQQDTVLQHSRMFGFRPLEDLAVTRFYTSPEIYDAMKKIQDIDNTLRASIEKGEQEVVFIQQDDKGKLRSCSPSKILLSTTIVLRPFKRLLPVGFQTDYKTNIERIIKDIDKRIDILSQGSGFENPFLIDLGDAIDIIERIYSTLKFEDDYHLDQKNLIACLEHLSKNSKNPMQNDQVWCLVRKDRNINRIVTKGHVTFSDAPDTSKTEGSIARNTAIDVPMLMLFRENGLEGQGWKGAAFYWPVMYAPKNTKVTMFATDFLR